MDVCNCKRLRFSVFWWFNSLQLQWFLNVEDRSKISTLLQCGVGVSLPFTKQLNVLFCCDSVLGDCVTQLKDQYHIYLTVVFRLQLLEASLTQNNEPGGAYTMNDIRLKFILVTLLFTFICGILEEGYNRSNNIRSQGTQLTCEEKCIAMTTAPQ